MTTLTKIVLSVAAIFVATDNSFAQSYSLVPNDTINLVGSMEDLETLSIQQQNISNSTLKLKWKKVSQSVPTNWEATVCDNVLCYTSLVDSGTMNPVYPSEYGLILLHITAHKNYGQSVVRYAVWDSTNSALKDTLTYILTVNNPLGVPLAENKNNFSIFPIPANQNIIIMSNFETGFKYVITDVAGKEFRTGISKTNSISISLENFASGLYIIAIYTENKTILSKQFLIQP